MRELCFTAYLRCGQPFINLRGIGIGGVMARAANSLTTSHFDGDRDRTHCSDCLQQRYATRSVIFSHLKPHIVTGKGAYSCMAAPVMGETFLPGGLRILIGRVNAKS